MPARRTRFLFFVFLFLFYWSVSGQAATPRSERLAYLGKVWGYLKYHHPRVAKGNLNWDSVLISAVPRVKAAQNKQEFNLVLKTVLNAAGTPSPIQAFQDKPGHLKINQDLSWLQNKDLFTKNILARLLAVRQGFAPQPNFYVSNGYQEESLGQPVFWRETAHEEIKSPSEAYRLLALFRFWNAVEYFYPHKYTLTQDWDEILLRFIPRFEAATDPLAYHLLSAELTATLHDAQAGAFSPLLREHFGQYSLPFRVSYLAGETVVTKILSDSLATAANIKLGDVWLTLNDLRLEDLRQKYTPYVGNPNPDARQHAINQKLIMGSAGKVNLGLKRGSEKFKTQVGRHRVDKLHAQYRRQTPAGSPWRLLPEKEMILGYLDAGNLTAAQIAPAFATLKNTEGLIVDLRSFLFTPLITDLVAYLYDQDTEPVQLTEADAQYPGTLNSYAPAPIRPSDGSPKYLGKMVILVNEQTFGLAELTALALRKTPGAVIMGSQTAGAYGNVSSVMLPGGIMATFTGQGASYPDGTSLQRAGVKIDVPVKPTTSSLQKGRDEVLENAVRYLKKSL